MFVGRLLIRTDPEDPGYLEFFRRMVRETGRPYDGHPGLKAINVFFVEDWEKEAVQRFFPNLCAKPWINSSIPA